MIEKANRIAFSTQWLRRHSIQIAIVALLAVVGLGYFRSNTIAPFFVSQQQCGPVAATIERTNIGSPIIRRLPISYPISDGGDPVEETYMNLVYSHLLGKIQSANPAMIGRSGTPFKLNVLFVEHSFGLNATNRFDQFGRQARLVSPWVRIVSSDWSPCSLQVIFFRQGRQIIRDQMEMRVGKRLVWSETSEVTSEQLVSYAREYEKLMLTNQTSKNKVKEISILHQKIPADIMVALLNAPQSTISPFGANFSFFQNGASLGFSENINNTVDKYFKKNGEYVEVSSIIENDYEKTGYSDINYIF